jgi:hypothetical protein
MVIIDDPPLLFVHIPKTAGTSITEALRPKGDRHHPLCLPRGYPHETVEEFARRVGEDVFRSYTSFCVVRQPLERFLSMYDFLRIREPIIPQMAEVTTIVSFIDAIKRNDKFRIILNEGHKVEGAATLARPQ